MCPCLNLLCILRQLYPEQCSQVVGTSPSLGLGPREGRDEPGCHFTLSSWPCHLPGFLSHSRLNILTLSLSPSSPVPFIVCHIVSVLISGELLSISIPCHSLRSPPAGGHGSSTPTIGPRRSHHLLWCCHCHSFTAKQISLFEKEGVVALRGFQLSLAKG